MNCPILEDFLNENNCNENIAGTSNKAYFFVKSDLAAPLTRTRNVYSTPVFKAGKGLYLIELKSNTQQIQGSSQGPNKGFNLTYQAVIDAVNRKVSELSRAFNNLDIGIIVVDGEDTQIMYDPNNRVEADTDGINSTTGAAPEDDRQTSLQFQLKGVKYQNLYVEAPQAGWESLRASSSDPTQSVADPAISPASFGEGETCEVSITCATAGAEIHYTLNGSTPTLASPVYSAAFTISATTTVKAIAVKSGLNDSNVVTKEYTKA